MGSETRNRDGLAGGSDARFAGVREAGDVVVKIVADRRK